MAVMTEMPTMAYGSWNSCQALLYAAYPAPGSAWDTFAPAALATIVVTANEAWVVSDVAEHPAAHPADLRHLSPPEVETGPPPEARPAAVTG